MRHTVLVLLIVAVNTLDEMLLVDVVHQLVLQLC